jgi:hypothetical protein
MRWQKKRAQPNQKTKSLLSAHSVDVDPPNQTRPPQPRLSDAVGKIVSRIHRRFRELQ